HRAGFVLHVDCPDLAMSRHLAFPELSNAQFLKIAEGNVEALNHALRDVPADRVRLHLCWGNYEGPHHRDIPLREILPIVLRAKPQALSFEGATPRHSEGPPPRPPPRPELLPIVPRPKPQALSFEGANPRHAHEWIVFREVKLPD